MASQQPAYQGMMGVQQPQSASIMNSQRAGMSGQIQGMVVQYTPMPSYQVMCGNVHNTVGILYSNFCVPSDPMLTSGARS